MWDVVGVGVAVAVLAGAQPEQPADLWRASEHVPTLAVGDPAPPLQIDHWLRGEPVESFEPGHIYVVDFWATWCGSCISGFPELAELQRDFADRGVTVIAVTNADDRGCTVEHATEMVNDPKFSMNFTVAMSDDAETYRAWARAAGHRGIPTTLVVAGDGRLASTGFVSSAGSRSGATRLLVESLLDGSFDWEAERRWHGELMEASAVEEHFSELLRAGDPGAYAFAREQLQGSLAGVAASMNQMASTILYLYRKPELGGGLEPNLELAYELASRAFALNSNEDDVWYYNVMAEAEFRMGRSEKAASLIRHAIAHAGGSSTEFMQGRLAEYEDGKD